MAGREAFAPGERDDAAAWPDGNPRAEGGWPPPEPDHAIELGPLEESVVGGVKDHQAASAADVRFERPLDRGQTAHAVLRVAAVEVVDHHVVAREIRQLRIAAYVHGETAGAFQNGADGGGGCGPIMVVQAIHHHCLELVLRAAGT